MARWSTTTSKAEELMTLVLRRKRRAMSLQQIVPEIQKLDPTVLSGSSPVNSLYSIIYRREQKRAENGEPPLFATTLESGTKLFTLR